MVVDTEQRAWYIQRRQATSVCWQSYWSGRHEDTCGTVAMPQYGWPPGIINYLKKNRFHFFTAVASIHSKVWGSKPECKRMSRTRLYPSLIIWTLDLGKMQLQHYVPIALAQQAETLGFGGIDIISIPPLQIFGDLSLPSSHPRDRRPCLTLYNTEGMISNWP